MLKKYLIGLIGLTGLAVAVGIGIGLVRDVNASPEPASNSLSASLLADDPVGTTSEESISNNDPEKGIVLTQVASDGPAAQAGLVRGDILLTINGVEVNHIGELQAQLKEMSVGDEVTLTFLHGDEERTATATLGGEETPYLGIGLCDCMATGKSMLPRDFHRFDLDMEGVFKPGAIITMVEPNTPAATAGLQEGDIVLAINDEAVDGSVMLADMIGQYASDDTITFKVMRGEETLEIPVTLGTHPEDAGKPYVGIQYHPTPFITMGRLPEDFEFDGLMPFDAPIQGAIINKILPDTPAANAGLQQGDVITEMDGQIVEDHKALVETIQSHQVGDEVTLTVLSGNETRQVVVTLAENEEGNPFLGVMIGGFIHMEHFKGQGMPALPNFSLEGHSVFPPAGLDAGQFEFPVPNIPEQNL